MDYGSGTVKLEHFHQKITNEKDHKVEIILKKEVSSRAQRVVRKNGDGDAPVDEIDFLCRFLSIPASRISN